MNIQERLRLERVIALLIIGVSHALQDGIITTTESERLLFSPHMMDRLQHVQALQDLVELIHIGTELDDVKRLLGKDKWIESIENLRSRAIAILCKTAESDSQLDKWFERFFVDHVK